MLDLDDQAGVLNNLWHAGLRFMRDRMMEAAGLALIVLAIMMTLALSTYNPRDPSFNNATADPPWNLMGEPGSYFADLVMQFIGLGAMAMVPPIAVAGWWIMAKQGPGQLGQRLACWIAAILCTSALAASLPFSAPAPLQTGLGGVVGDWTANLLAGIAGSLGVGDPNALRMVSGIVAAAGALVTFGFAIGMQFGDYKYRIDDDPSPHRRTQNRRPVSRRRASDDDDDGESLLDRMRDWASGLGGAIGAITGRMPKPALSSASSSRTMSAHDDDGYEDVPAAPWERGGKPAKRRNAPAVPHPALSDAYEPGHAAPQDPPFPEHDAAYEAQTDDLPPDDPAAYDGPLEPADPVVTLREDDDPNWDDDSDWEERPAAPVKKKRAFSLGRLLSSNPVKALTDKIASSDLVKGKDDAPDDPTRMDEAESDALPPSPAPEKPKKRVKRITGKTRKSKREKKEAQPTLDLDPAAYSLPPLSLLSPPPDDTGRDTATDDVLEANARQLETVLQDFGVKGEIINVRPGPVVTLYELQPAPGIKSSRVIGLADDIARSMSAVSARVAVIPGRNVIGIELPNKRREMVMLRELLAAESYEKASAKIALALGKDIGGESIIVDLATMPHLLIAGTTGSGKSVAINTMILSLLYRLPPSQCKLILIDPKMLELSVYEGIPHLLSPVVTDPKKAVVALKWVVREMEDRYRKMSKLGVRNIRGYNERVKKAAKKGEVLTREVQTGFDKETGEPIYEQEELSLEPMPFIVVVVDEMADLMMVAGKDIEGAVQRLAQMARAAGIHLITATQRPSVDVITGTIKANFPTRISFQVTSKIDSRTILGEQGAEQLLGQGDMLYMAGGGRIKRVHGPFVSDSEVEDVVAELKAQGAPSYVESITEESDDDPQSFLDMLDGESSGDDLYDQAVAIVARDKKASTSYIQRKLQIGYNRAARLIERMEEEGVVSQANHVGKREVLVRDHSVDAENF